MVIMIIGNSISRAFALVGALSIIRFRTAIKEPEQLIYLLMCTGIGIGAAANQLEAVLIGTAIFSILSFWMNKKYNNDNKSTELHSGQILNLETNKYISVDEILKKIELIKYSNPNLISFDTVGELNIYSISVSGKESELIDFLKENFPEANISFAKQK